MVYLPSNKEAVSKPLFRHQALRREENKT